MTISNDIDAILIRKIEAATHWLQIRTRWDTFDAARASIPAGAVLAVLQGCLSYFIFARTTEGLAFEPALVGTMIIGVVEGLIYGVVGLMVVLLQWREIKEARDAAYRAVAQGFRNPRELSYQTLRMLIVGLYAFLIVTLWPSPILVAACLYEYFIAVTPLSPNAAQKAKAEREMRHVAPASLHA